MAHWLLKTEPSEYSYEQLERERKTAWDGVANAVALKHLRAMKKGDLAVVYHTGNERRAVGIAEVRSAAYPDPAGDDDRLVVVDIAARARLVEPVTLDTLKGLPEFTDSPLVRMGRLSVVPLDDAQWKRLLALARTRI